MRIYPNPGDSPKAIAARYRIPVDTLLAANPQKQTTMVDGQATWTQLFRNEPINIPTLPGMVGDAAQDAINAVIAAGGPCVQANVMLVCAAQMAMGVKVDGKWGTDTATAARARVPNAPAACSPRPGWWAPVGQSSCPIVAPSAPIVAPTVTPAAAPAAVLALTTIDPCQQANVAIVCAAQKALGVSVDGKYGTGTAAAAAKLLGASAPPACSPRPLWWAPVGQSNCGGAVVVQPPPVVAPAPAPAPIGALAPAAVLMLATINPCLQENVAAVYAAQRALGVAADGKYGTDTATAARRILPSAPAACSPRPLWWAPVGQVNPIPSGSAIPSIPSEAIPPPPVVVVSPPAPPSPGGGTTPSGGGTTPSGGQVVVAPEEPKKGLSTGAMVVGAIGAVAVVGLAAVALSKKGSRGARGKRGARGPARRKHKRKSSHKRRK